MGTGYLKVTTTAKDGNLPVQANIVVFLEEKILHDIHTNKIGITEKLPLDAPPKELALDPNYTGIPYSTYSIKAIADGFATQTIHGVRIFDTITSILPISMSTHNCDEYFIPAHNLIKPTTPSMTTSPGGHSEEEVQIPAHINIEGSTQIPFIDYIQNVASQILYPTWPPAAIEANIYAIISQALNKADRIYIDPSPIYDNIAQLVGSIFNRYIKREGETASFLSIYSDGRHFTCPGLWQWGSVALAERGYNALEILRHYYPEDIEIIETNNIGEIEPFPGYTLQEGMNGQHVKHIQTMLNNIRNSFPEIPEINPVDGKFGSNTAAAVAAFQGIHEIELDPPTGTVSKSTWYRISIFDCNRHDNVSLDMRENLPKEHIDTGQLMTMYLLSQIYSRHAGNYI